MIHPSEDELYLREKAYQKGPEKTEQEVTRPANAPPTYDATMQQLPLGFYFPDELKLSVERADFAYPGQAIPIYDPNAPLPKAFRRPWHDTFRPPNGPPTFFPISIGYGAEVGLSAGQQALWDPNGKFYFFLDHNEKVTFFEDPRPPVLPPPIVTKEQVILGDRRRETQLPPVCADPNVITATGLRALSKPHGCTLMACGVHGPNGAPGVTGQLGSQWAHWPSWWRFWWSWRQRRRWIARRTRQFWRKSN